MVGLSINGEAAVLDAVGIAAWNTTEVWVLFVDGVYEMSVWGCFYSQGSV